MQVQHNNLNLMNKLSVISDRKNDYVNCDSKSGTMMSKQTRVEREKQEIEKIQIFQLSCYLLSQELLLKILVVLHFIVGLVLNLELICLIFHQKS